MKWNELTLKDRKILYDNIRKVYPDISYLEIKEQFNNIPKYEDGKESKLQEAERKWKEYKLSIGKDTASTYKGSEYYRPKDFNPKSGNNKQLSESNLFPILSGLSESLSADLVNDISNSGEKIKKAAISTNEEKYEKTKEGLAVAGVLGQAALSFAGNAAASLGKPVLAGAIEASSAILDTYETIEALNNRDNLSLLQNAIPLGLYGLSNLKHLPRYSNNQNIDILSTFGRRSGVAWDWLANPSIEGFKIKENRY